LRLVIAPDITLLEKHKVFNTKCPYPSALAGLFIPKTAWLLRKLLLYSYFKTQLFEKELRSFSIGIKVEKILRDYD
jgi:hypothetical protein